MHDLSLYTSILAHDYGEADISLVCVDKDRCRCTVVLSHLRRHIRQAEGSPLRCGSVVLDFV